MMNFYYQINEERFLDECMSFVFVSFTEESISQFYLMYSSPNWSVKACIYSGNTISKIHLCAFLIFHLVLDVRDKQNLLQLVQD